jgi:RNA polymerase sigma factor FliA
VIGLVGALDEFHGSNLACFADFAKLKIRMRSSIVCLNLSGRPKSNDEKENLLKQRSIICESGVGAFPKRRLNGIEIGTLHSRRRKDSAQEDIVDLGSWPEGGSRLRAQHADLQKRLTAAIKNLPERERLVLNLSYYEDLTLREIGFVLDEPEPHVSQIHASAILYLRSELADCATPQRIRQT